MGEKNKDLDNLYLQCQSCVNKYTSFECALNRLYKSINSENFTKPQVDVIPLAARK